VKTVYEWKTRNAGGGCARLGVCEDNVAGGHVAYYEHTDGEDAEIIEDERILAYWRSIGSPVVEVAAAGCAAPWFPWESAGFADKDVALLSRNMGGGAVGFLETLRVADLGFHHRSDEDWAEFASLCKAHPEWTLNVIARYFAVTRDYAMRLVGMYLSNTLPALAKQFPEITPEELISMVGVFAEEYLESLDSDWMAGVVEHWGSIWRYWGLGA
jgi:hypothetical protein